MKSKTYTQNKESLDKTQSSKFCQLGVKRTRFQNLKEKRKWFFYHSTTLRAVTLTPVMPEYAWLSLDATCIWVKLPVDDRIQPRSNKFVMGVENKATGDSKLVTALPLVTSLVRCICTIWSWLNGSSINFKLDPQITC